MSYTNREMSKIEYVRDYILAGNATFTLMSTKIDERFTYNIRKDNNHNARYHVRVMFGSENTDMAKSYMYLGIYYNTASAAFVCKTKKRANDVRVKMIKQFLEFCSDPSREYLPDTCRFFMSMHCARCGRLLTTPESVTYGFGPKCMKAR